MCREEIKTDEGFQQKLNRLRTRIDLLPAEQRPHLHDLADSIARQQRRLEDRKLSQHDSQ